MTTLKTLTLISAVLLATPAMAEDSFMGISLTAPFPGEIAECPKRVDMDVIDYARAATVGLCFHAKSSNEFMLLNGPDLGLGHTLVVNTVYNKPTTFKLTFAKSKFAQAAETFVERFGKAKTYRQETVHTRSGDSYQSRDYEWRTKSLRIVLHEIGDDVRWSQATVYNSVAGDEVVRKDKEKAVAAAKQL
ncbi:hypothetical protein [Herbaspirillum huttiense]|uniref:hypothetical protein n=1 Tax=Herbaspirillum huttiense TaxID=863372 RepID=UPI0031D66112